MMTQKCFLQWLRIRNKMNEMKNGFHQKSKYARAAVALGSNLGDRHQLLLNAKIGILKMPDCSNFVFSSIYETVPTGTKEDAPTYLNAAVIFDTNLQPHVLLDELLRIEKINDRERLYRNAPRTLDLDLLLYGDQTISDSILTVPHPRMQDRFFVLTPLAEIYGLAIHPVMHKSISELEMELMKKSSKEDFIQKTDYQF